MKTKLYVVLSTLVLLFGCKDKEQEYPLDSPPMPTYLLAIELLDQQGTNISEIAATNTTGEVVYSDSTSWKLSMQCWPYLEDDNVTYYILKTIGYSHDNHTGLTWKIKCKEIFGNDDIHTIESKWERNGESYLRRCISFDVSGKTYYPELKNGYWTARVVVNR